MSHPLLADDGKAIRDPVWGYIYVPEPVLSLVDTEDFQRLRNITQLGHVHLVFPGARHSRFEHSLGVFHLSKRFLARLIQATPPIPLSDEDTSVFLAAALLHDIGHYPFSHTLEDLQPYFIKHEARARALIMDPARPIHQILRQQWSIDPLRVANVIDYAAVPPPEAPRDRMLANILSGTLDPDKIDYLLRDAMFCGVPFGESVNRDRLVSSLRYDPDREQLAISSKGVSAVEALVFTNYLMFRNVYWHHAVRAATAMLKRAVLDVLVHPGCQLRPEECHHVTEGELVMLLRQEQQRLGLAGAAELLEGTVHRRLYKVAAVIYPKERNERLMGLLFQLYRNPGRQRQKEVELCRIFGAQLGRRLQGHELLIDIPAFTKSPEFDLRVFYGKAMPSEKPDPLSFDDPEVSRLRDSLVLNFEDQAKTFRIYCQDDPELRAVVSTEVKHHLS